MNWAKTMSAGADDAANGGVASDASSQHTVLPGPWDPHQVWLTRVKQPRDGRQQPSAPPPAKPSSQTSGAKFWTRAIR